MTIWQLMYLCWDYEWVCVEDTNDNPLCEPEEAAYLVKNHPELGNRNVVTFFIGTRFVKSLKKSIPVLVFAVTVE